MLNSATSRKTNTYDFETVVSKNVLDQPVRSFLAKTYGTLALTCLACTYGVQASSLVALNPTFLAISMCLVMAMICLSSSEGPRKVSPVLRIVYVAGFGFLQGFALGDIVADALALDPNMIMAAVFIVTVVFLSFTLAVLLSNKRETIYTGSTALAMQVCLIAQLATGIQVENQIMACGLLCLFCAYLAYDTQLLIVRCRGGDQDFVRGALQLFLDGIVIFVRVLAFLSTQTKQRRNSGRVSRKYL